MMSISRSSGSFSEDKLLRRSAAHRQRAMRTSLQRCLPLALSVLASLAAAAETLTCPLAIPASTLTMECSSVCPDALFPCIYYAAEEDCIAEPEQDSGSVCVSTASSGACAVECFAPFNQTTGDAWNFMITDEHEYKQDVIARMANDNSFQLAKKSVSDLKAIGELRFPSSVKSISISGNALPVVDKTAGYTVIPRGQYVDVNVESFSFLKNADSASTITIENINLKNMTAIPLLSKLTKLHLSNGGLTAVPSGISELQALQRLDLSMNALVAISSGSLPSSLIDLDIGWNDFTDSNALASLPSSLEKLRLVAASLSSLPASFPTMKSLKMLVLSGNRLTSIEQGTLPPSLSSLNLSINALSSIDDAAFPSTLETLDLHANRLTASSLPTDLSSLTHLTTLYLHANKLECIPSAVFTVPKLTALSLHRNPSMKQVTLSEAELEALSQLTTFSIDANALVTSCDSPKAIGATNFRVCVTGDPTIHTTPTPTTAKPVHPTEGADDHAGHAKSSTGRNRQDDSGDKTWQLVIGVSAGVIGIVVLFVVVMLIASRRQALVQSAEAMLIMGSSPGDGKDRQSSGGRTASVVSDLSVIEHRDDDVSDATAYREMTSDAVVATTKGQAVTQSSASISKSSSVVEGEAVTSTSMVTAEGGVTVVKKVTKTTRTMKTAATAETHASAASTSVSTHQTTVRERPLSECEL